MKTNMRKCSGYCGRTLELSNFYQRADEKTRVDKCKNCFTKGVKNDTPSTIIPLLKDLDRPWSETLWKKCLKLREIRFPNDVEGGQGVFGKYLVALNMAQYKEYRFSSSTELEEFLKETESKKDNDIEQDIEEEPKTPLNSLGINFENELSKEERIYLAKKWGCSYSINDCLKMEGFENDMRQSFDISDKSRDTDVHIAALSLFKAYEALERGLVKDYQVFMGVYDKTLKRGHFTAAQNKEGKDNTINSIAQLAEICERNSGFVPRKLEVEYPEDIVDATLKDQKEWMKKLVMTDLGFGKQMEDAIARIEKDAKEAIEELRQKVLNGEAKVTMAEFHDLYANLDAKIKADSEMLDEMEYDETLGEDGIPIEDLANDGEQEYPPLEEMSEEDKY